jgi:hypothetical protein
MQIGGKGLMVRRGRLAAAAIPENKSRNGRAGRFTTPDFPLAL